MRGTPRVGWAVATAAALVVGLASCGGGDDGTGLGSTEAADEPSDATSSPFLVDAVPEGYRPVATGTGTARQDWGEDCCGSHEPFTVLTPPGDDVASDDAVVVSTSGFAGQQGGFGGGVRPGDGRTRFEVDGRPAAHVPATTGEGGEQYDAELAVVRGEDLAVNVTAAGDVDRDELLDIAERVEVDPGDHLRAPTIESPPDGLAVVGSVGADVQLAILPRLRVGTDAVPGPVTAHAVGWVGPSSGAATEEPPGVTVLDPGDPTEDVPAGTPTLAVLTLPGRSADLAAVPGLSRFRFTPDLIARSSTVAGAPAVLLERAGGTAVDRAVVTRAAWGDLLVVATSGPVGTALGEDALAAVAASVRQADAAAWNAFRVEVIGGTGLPPDPGSTEVARGTAGQVDWMLQATPGPNGAPLVDRCLKLSTGDRACASQPGGTVHSDPPMASPPAVTYARRSDVGPGVEFPGFAIVAAPGDVPTIRVTTDEATATAATAPVPGSDLRAAIVFVAGAGTPDCAGDLAAPAPDRMAVELLDAAGTATACVQPSGDVTPL